MQNMNEIRNHFSRLWLIFHIIIKSILENFKKCVSLAILVRVANDIILMVLR